MNKLLIFSLASFVKTVSMFWGFYFILFLKQKVVYHYIKKKKYIKKKGYEPLKHPPIPH